MKADAAGDGRTGGDLRELRTGGGRDELTLDGLGQDQRKRDSAWRVRDVADAVREVADRLAGRLLLTPRGRRGNAPATCRH